MVSVFRVRLRPLRRSTVLGTCGPICAGLLLLTLGCEPEFTDRASEVTGQRVLAVQVAPAQVAPDTEVALSALVVSPEGTVQNPDINWGFCMAPKPVAEINDVNASCTMASAGDVQNLGTGATASGTVPEDACRLFGPDVPQGTNGRPADPDPSGGYYQPVRVAIAGTDSRSVAIGEVRLSCGLPNSSAAATQEFKTRSKPNTNPELLSVEIVGDSKEPLATQDSGESTRVAPGATITLRASWPECPAESSCGDGYCTIGERSTDCPEDCKEPRGCTGAEQYLYYDPLTLALSERREEMRVAWFASAGSFISDHSERSQDETETYTDNDWTAPESPETVYLWAVLRDNRAGTAWQSYRIDVR